METSKPDLMGAKPRAAQDKRILAQLEHGARTPAVTVRAAAWSVDGWTIGLCVLLLLMCSVAWLIHDQRITPESFRYRETMRSTAAPAKTARHARSETSADQAATIVNEAADARTAMPRRAMPDGGAWPAASAGKIATTEVAAQTRSVATGMTSASMAAGTSASMAAGTSASMAAGTSASMAAGTSASVAAGMASASASVPTPTAVTAAIANAAATQSPSPARAAPYKPARAAASAPQAQPGSDTDVTLLAALVAHAGQPAIVAPERSRDIVERHNGDTTAQLLARCKQLGLIEGMLCRSRICSGRWEADAACRAPAY